MSEKQKNKDTAPVYKSGYADALKSNLAKVMEKKNFSYDANKDKLFSQYKDSYEKSGKTAMQDTMGNAATLMRHCQRALSMQLTVRGTIKSKSNRTMTVTRILSETESY